MNIATDRPAADSTYVSNASGRLSLLLQEPAACRGAEDNCTDYKNPVRLILPHS